MNKITRAVLTAVAAGAALLTTTTPAIAATDYCGTTVNDYGKVGFTSCWWTNDDNSVEPMATLHTYSTMDSTLWTACTMRIYVFRELASETSFRQVRTSEQDCLSSMQYLSISAPATLAFWDARPFFVGNASYKVVSRWFGTYNGSPVGSHVNAESQVIFGLAPAGLETVNDGLSVVPGVAIPAPPV
jgi:hypothetical protein